MQGPGSLILSVLMIAAVLLAAGGAHLLRRGERFKGGLMLVAAAVALGNVLIWT